MKGKIYKKGLAVLLGLTLAANLPVTSPLSIHMLDSYAYTGAATVKASSLNVRSDAGTGYSAVARLAAGASIQITGEKKGTDGKTWYWNHRRLRRHHCGHRLQWSLLHTSEGISHHIPRYSFLRLIPGV